MFCSNRPGAPGAVYAAGHGRSELKASGMSAARGEQVSSLVSAMQAGTITKSELFVSLSELQRSSASPQRSTSDSNKVQTLVGGEGNCGKTRPDRIQELFI